MMTKIFMSFAVFLSLNAAFADSNDSRTLRDLLRDHVCFIVPLKDIRIPKKQNDIWVGDLSFSLVSSSPKNRIWKKGEKLKVEAFTSGILNTGNPSDGQDGWIRFEGIAFRTDPVFHSLETGDWRIETTRWLPTLPIAQYRKLSRGGFEAVCRF